MTSVPAFLSGGVPRRGRISRAAVPSLLRRALQTGPGEVRDGPRWSVMGSVAVTVILTWLHKWERCWQSDPEATDLFSQLPLISGCQGPVSRAWRTQKEAQAGSEFWLGHAGKLFSLRVSFLVCGRGSNPYPWRHCTA